MRAIGAIWLGAALALVLALPGAVAAQDCEGDACGSPFDRFLDRFSGEMWGLVDPWLNDLGALLGDLSGWHAPEVLPNGDILIRRRRPEAQPPEDDGSDGGSGGDSDGEAPVTEPLEL